MPLIAKSKFRQILINAAILAGIVTIISVIGSFIFVNDQSGLGTVVAAVILLTFPLTLVICLVPILLTSLVIRNNIAQISVALIMYAVIAIPIILSS